MVREREEKFALEKYGVKSGGPTQSFSLPPLQLCLFLAHWQYQQLQFLNKHERPGLQELQKAHNQELLLQPPVASV